MVRGKTAQLDREIADALARRPWRRHHAARSAGADAWVVAMDAILENDPQRAAQVVKQIRGKARATETLEFSQALQAAPDEVRAKFLELTAPKPPSSKLSKAWPAVARDVLVDAARRYNRAVNEPWAVPDVEMRRVIDEAQEELWNRRDEFYEDASPRWIDRWERGELDAEMERAIQEASRRMSRAERVIRPRSRL